MKVINRGELIWAMGHELIRICARDVVWPADVLRGRRCQRSAAVRIDLTDSLRKRYVQRGQSRFTEFAVLDAGEAAPDGWKPLSYPNIAAFLGVDHSAVIHGQRFLLESRSQSNGEVKA